MKKFISLFAFLIPIFIFGQIPQGISYQAIALDATGNPVASSNVGFRLSIIDGSATGTVLYSETHLKTTTALGLFNLVIGQGTVVTGNFATINWASSSKFLKSEIDVAGGTDYVLVGTTQLLSVPYALTAGSLSGTNANDSIEDNKTANFVFASTSGTVYTYNSDNSTWVGQAGNPDANGLVGSNKNVAFGSTSGTVYAFNASTNTWVGQTGSMATSGILRGSNGNFVFASTSGTVYAFNKNTGTWLGQSGVISNGYIESNGNFAFASTSGTVYAFNSKTNTWVGQSGTTTGSGALVGSNGNFCFSSTSGNVYAFNKNTGVWTGRSGNINGYIESSPSN